MRFYSKFYHIVVLLEESRCWLQNRLVAGMLHLDRGSCYLYTKVPEYAANHRIF